ncbi:MAG TPA: cytochrome c [Azospirillum sp.]|nr:cytochrome c [Azospirillum sp.]
MDHRILNALMAAAVSAGLSTAFTPAQAASPVEQVAAREQAMKRMGSGVQAVGKYLKGEGGSPADARSAAAAITEVSSLNPKQVFAEGTGIGVAKSDAKPELWQNFGKVQEIWAQLKPAAAKLDAAGSSGNKQQIAQAMQEVGKVCSSCHENYRRTPPTQ